jgi:hypothetical protein
LRHAAARCRFADRQLGSAGLGAKAVTLSPAELTRNCAHHTIFARCQREG